MKSNLLLKEPDMITHHDCWETTVKTARFILFKMKHACPGGQGGEDVENGRNVSSFLFTLITKNTTIQVLSLRTYCAATEYKQTWRIFGDQSFVFSSIMFIPDASA
jgi:hypothetical protein